MIDRRIYHACGEHVGGQTVGRSQYFHESENKNNPETAMRSCAAPHYICWVTTTLVLVEDPATLQGTST